MMLQLAIVQMKVIRYGLRQMKKSISLLEEQVLEEHGPTKMLWENRWNIIVLNVLAREQYTKERLGRGEGLKFSPF